MSKKMLINATHPEESRVATVEDGILTELDIETEGREQTRGNIYKATVVRVETGLQAAFIDYGAERLGFLQMGELHPSFFKAFEVANEGKGRPRINDLLRRGQDLLVQVVKEERGTKGAALTTYISLPGRFMVLMPDSDTKGVSRKIEDESQRKKLKEAMAALNLPTFMGYIVRTAGIGQKKEELKRDFDYLVRVWDNIQTINRQAKAPALVYKESNLVIRSIRDYFSSDMDEVLVDDPQVYEEARDFFQQVMPEYVRLVKLHQERRPIFSRYQIEEQIETLSRNKVLLPSGGSIVIDATEALVAIDVNSGKMAGEQGVEGTAFKTNLEAATEVGRQLRLRDLGGLIVIDFIDMRDRKHIREVEKNLKDSLKSDKARVTVGRISQFGLMEMSRQRIKATLAEGSYLPCPNCGGSGRIKSAEAQAIAFLRKLHAAIIRGQVERIEGEVPIDVAHYLLNNKREELLEMERRYQASIFVRARKSFVASQFELIVHKREKEEVKTETWIPVTGGQHLIAPAPPTSTLTIILPAETLPVELPPDPLPQEPTEAADLETTEETGKKKRKRRRRKKKKAEGEVVETTLQGELAQVEAEEDSEDEDESEVASSEVAEVGAEEGAKKKRKRRRRKKKKSESPTDPAAIVIEEPLAASELASPETIAPAADEARAVDPSGKPEKRRRGRKPAAHPPQELPTALQEPSSEPVPPVPQPAAERETAEVSTPVRSKRPARRKPTEDEVPIEAAAPLTAPVKLPQPDLSEVPAKPSRSRGRKPAVTKPVDTPEKAEPTTAIPAEVAAAPVPTSRRRKPKVEPQALPDPSPTKASPKPRAPRKKKSEGGD